jgi:glucose-6-phosphate isomerase
MSLQVQVSGAAEQAALTEMPILVSDRVASRLFAKDFTLWGTEAESEASIRLGFVDAAKNSMALIPSLKQLRTELLEKGLTRVVLCGMGGSSLAPEVIAGTFGVPLVVLDSTEPSQVMDAISESIEKTIVVVSSKSGSTVETDSQKRIFEESFTKAGIDKTERIFIVTDPGSPMEIKALEDGYRVFNADPTVGGRYSALTAFGVVPCMLAGVNMEAVLRNAVEAVDELSVDSDSNPGLVLGAAMARTMSESGFKDKLGFIPDGTKIVDFGDWLEQLIAESTGKIDRGVLPVVLAEKSAEIKASHEDLLLIGLSKDASKGRFEVSVSGDIGEQMMLWEVATVVASRLLGVNPFDQPDVESAKIAARAMLESPADQASYLFEEAGIRVSASGLGLSSKSNLKDAISAFGASVDVDGYISIQAYLNRLQDGEFLKIRDLLAKKYHRPTTFGWGPRFLHSTGQYHKGGPKQGIFLQIRFESEFDLPVPGREFSFGELIASQANGDQRVLAATNRPVLSLTLGKKSEGIRTLLGLLS